MRIFPSALTLVAAIALAEFIAAPAFADDKKNDPLAQLKLSGSPFEVCQNRAFLSSSVFKKDMEYWTTVIEECRAETQLEVLPDTGWYNSIVTKLGGANDEAKAVQFLGMVGKDAEKAIEHNIAATKKLADCAQKPAEAGCVALLERLAESINKVRPQLRQALALSAYEQFDQRQERAEESRNINHRMNPASASLAFEGKMEKLDAAEIAQAAEMFKKDTVSIKTAWKESVEKKEAILEEQRAQGVSEREIQLKFPWASQLKSIKSNYRSPEYLKFQESERQAKFEQYRAEYVQAIYKAPILAFLGKKGAAESCAQSADSANESCAALATAAKKLHENAVAERENVSKLLKQVSSKEKQNASDLIELMKYGPIVRDVLGKNPEYCGTATGLANLVANTKTRDTVGISVGMIAGFMAGGWGGGALLGAAGFSVNTAKVLGFVAAGVGTTSYLYAVDKGASDDAERRTFGHATEDDGIKIGDIQDFTEAQDVLLLNIATMPLAVFGTGVSKLAVFGALSAVPATVAASMAQHGAKMGASQAVRKTLLQKGHKAAEIDQLFKELNGKDAAKAAKAAETLITDLGIDSHSLSLIRTAVSKGLISSVTQRSAMNAIRAEIKDGEMALRVLKNLEDVNPKLLTTDAKKQEALSVALAAAKLGVDDPKYIATAINEWRDGLESLSVSYKMATEMLEKPEVRKLATQRERQEMAFHLANRERVANDPVLGLKSKSEQDDIVKNLNSCGMRAKAAR